MAAVSGDIGDAGSQADETLEQLLFKRARLVGSAANKIPELRELLIKTQYLTKHPRLAVSAA